SAAASAIPLGRPTGKQEWTARTCGSWRGRRPSLRRHRYGATAGCRREGGGESSERTSDAPLAVRIDGPARDRKWIAGLFRGRAIRGEYRNPDSADPTRGRKRTGARKRGGIGPP